jgi:hypothetical protein
LPRHRPAWRLEGAGPVGDRRCRLHTCQGLSFEIGAPDLSLCGSANSNARPLAPRSWSKQVLAEVCGCVLGADELAQQLAQRVQAALQGGTALAAAQACDVRSAAPSGAQLRASAASCGAQSLPARLRACLAPGGLAGPWALPAKPPRTCSTAHHAPHPPTFFPRPPSLCFKYISSSYPAGGALPPGGGFQPVRGLLAPPGGPTAGLAAQ